LAIGQHDCTQWSNWDLTQITGGRGGYYPRGYVRSDGVNAVVYYSPDYHIHEMALPNGGYWSDTDLSAKTGTGGGEFPIGYQRTGRVSAVVYRNIDGHIHELAREFNAITGFYTWQDYDLNKLTGSVGGYFPKGYVRADWVNSVVYSGYDGHIHELTLENGRWSAWDLSWLSGGAGGQGPMGSVRWDGVTSVVYHSSDGHIQELTLKNGQWSAFDLTGLSRSRIGGGWPMGDGRNDAGLYQAVVYAGADGHIHELVGP
jgi:hypothetical protein